MQRSLEQRMAIKFCVKLEKSAAETIPMLKKAFGVDCLSDRQIFRCHKAFAEGREDVNDKNRAGRSATSSSNDNVKRVRDVLNTDRRLSVRLISETLDITKTIVHKIVSESLGMRKEIYRGKQKLHFEIMDSHEEASKSDYEEILQESGSDTSVESFSNSSSNSGVSADLPLVRNWCELQPDAPAPPVFPFTAVPAVNLDTTDEWSILQYFEAFLDDGLITHIVNETNRYADQKKRGKNWFPVTSAEMRVFLGLELKRFEAIHQNLHFSNNDEFDEASHPNPRLNKIWPVYDCLVTKFREAITPEKYIAIDESLLLYKGRLGWIQYIPLKRARFGIKTYMLCESKSGYVWNFIIYTGKQTNLDADYKDLPVSSQQIMEKYHQTEFSCRRGRPSANLTPLRLTGRHFPEYIPATEKKKTQHGNAEYVAEFVMPVGKKSAEKLAITAQIPELTRYAATRGQAGTLYQDNFPRRRVERTQRYLVDGPSGATAAADRITRLEQTENRPITLGNSCFGAEGF
ncbi:hypothetical protein NQ318_015692 [Aromia moschata]|uniref:PiggyBac transposable element-derived protein domain-containing protein n=1 Tax=Aromia moschata TaxID=1265417 RepID=A0AAV8YJ84_9CUCU|nr:hypothetical protein NQ318_015692 [Aromia moschata]